MIENVTTVNKYTINKLLVHDITPLKRKSQSTELLCPYVLTYAMTHYAIHNRLHDNPFVLRFPAEYLKTT